MAKLMSLRAYARHRGIGLNAVQLAIRNGRIKIHSRTPTKTLIDAEQADVDWAANTDPTKQNNVKNLFKNNQDQEEQKTKSTFSKAKLNKEIVAFEIMKLELLEKQGKLIDAERVKAEAFRIARQCRDNLMNLPDRLCVSIAAAIGENVDPVLIHKLMDDEIRKSLEGLANENP